MAGLESQAAHTDQADSRTCNALLAPVPVKLAVHVSWCLTVCVGLLDSGPVALPVPVAKLVTEQFAGAAIAAAGDGAALGQALGEVCPGDLAWVAGGVQWAPDEPAYELPLLPVVASTLSSMKRQGRPPGQFGRS